MAVTMQDIAKLAGVSRPVVSAVLNGNSKLKVAPATRSRILELASKTGYTRNLSARMLNGKTTHSVALFINPEFSPIYRDLQYQLTLHLAAHDYRVLQFPLLTARTTSEILQDALQFGLDGILTIDCPIRVLQAELKTPMVSLMQSTSKELDAGVNFQAGMQQITRHLLEHGHRRIALIGGGLRYQQAKVTGFRQACETFGVSSEHAHEIDLLWNAAFDAQLKHLLLQEKVTALATTSDYIAVRLIGYLSRLGLRVPEDVAVTGFDGDMYAVSGACRLTTVRQPIQELGRLGVELLRQKILDQQCGPLEEPILLEPSLHLGDSCGCQTAPDKTIFWERVLGTLESQPYVIQAPPPELMEDYQVPPHAPSQEGRHP